MYLTIRTARYRNISRFFVSDNGQTLDIDKLGSDKISYCTQQNTGGAGGFTRGLMEILKNGNPHGITHALLMDDDITIDTESIEKTYTILSLLKDEYADAFYRRCNASH